MTRRITYGAAPPRVDSLSDLRWYQKQWIPFWRIHPLQGVDLNAMAYLQADADALASCTETEIPTLPALPYTEGNPEWTMLYNHIRIGQIRPERIRRMRRVDLEFIAANVGRPIGPTPNPYAVGPGVDRIFERQRGDMEASEMKLAGNVARAARELQRRDTFRSSFLVGAAGALLGGAGLAAFAG
jgi:hypothetical protein